MSATPRAGVPVEEKTITSDGWRQAQAPAGAGERPQLVMIAVSDRPHDPSSRHLLDGLREVRFGRGERAASRTDATTLELKIPDRRMSSSHGRLVLRDAGWMLDDPESKNGALVDGEITRCTVLTDGALIELGHSFFMFRHAPVERDAAPDMSDAELRGPTALHSFDGALAARFAQLAQIAAGPASLILLGETGTGKEVVARAFHALTGRGGEFVAVNCGGLPANLIEAELFGHRRGAFTGALGDRVGLVRSAHGGTLFLDEIGELPLAAQAVLLRVLQEREVVPVGGDQPIKVDLRLCSATHRNLEELIAAGRFRDDLYARLMGVTVELPPLRHRQVDLGLLIRRLLARTPGGAAAWFTPSALRAMLRHPWRLNVRELEKTLTTAVALASDGMIDLPQLSDTLSRAVRASTPPVPAAIGASPPAAPPRSAGDSGRRERLIEALARHGGHVVAVARELQVGRGQLYRLFERYELDPKAFRRPERRSGPAAPGTGDPNAPAASRDAPSHEPGPDGDEPDDDPDVDPDADRGAEA